MRVAELLFPGDVVAEGVFGGVAPGALTAATPAHLVVLEADLVHELLANAGETPPWLMHAMTVRVRRAENRQSNLMLVDVRTRLARFLLDWCEATRTVHVPGPFRGGLARTVLAEVIGSTRHTLNRTLHDFEKRGVVVMENGGVTVEDFVVIRRCAVRASSYLHGVDRPFVVKDPCTRRETSA
jgi:CRP/FNR family cyclic AMP-dependent transcriptional regulator